MGYTKLINNYWATASKQVDDTWEEIVKDEEGTIVSPQGLVDQIANDKQKELEAQAEKDRDALMLAGKDYDLNGTIYKVSFTKADGDGVVQVKNGFEMGLSDTTIHFKNGTKMPISATDFTAFATWFVTERDRFF